MMQSETVKSSITNTNTPTVIPPKTKVSKNTLPTLPTITISATIKPTITPTSTRIPGETKLSPIDGMVLMYIPAGRFQMGSLETDAGADTDEFPQHWVNLNAYWMDQIVVTNAMFAHFLNDMGNQVEDSSIWLNSADEDVLIYYGNGQWNPVRGYEQHPVVEVSWYGARSYCHWAGRRLPTEAEWEKAARGLDRRIYPWGNELDCGKAQYADCSGGLLEADSKPEGASPYGILGLSGNTWEWTADWYAADYYKNAFDKNPTGPIEGESRVLRGGSWEYDWKHLRVTNRRHNGPAVSIHDYSSGVS